MNRLNMSAIAVAISLAFSAGAVGEGLPDLQTHSGTGGAGTANADATLPTRASQASESAAIGEKAIRESQTYSGTDAETPAIPGAISPAKASQANESAAIVQKALRNSQTYSGAGAERPAIVQVKPVTSETE